MKATLAFVACLLTAGFLTAAEVTGNNTAVVIRKNAVKSDTGYQFLCVPVNGLDIANGATTKIKLSTFLPASSYTDGTVVMDTAGNTIAEISEGEWSVDELLDGGTIFWLSVGPTNTKSNSPIVFCGQDRIREAPEAEDGISPQKNDSSVALKLGQIVKNPGAGDRVLVLKDGSSDYAQYKFDGVKWWGPGFKNDCTDVAVIAPGEAVYYYKK